MNMQTPEKIGTMHVDDIRAFVGKNADYYLAVFSQIGAAGGSFTMTGFNVWAFFFPFIWLFYRKMYLFGIIAFLISVLVLGVGWLISGIAMGICGNYLYYKHAETQLNRLQHMDNASYASALKTLGGTNMAIPVIALALTVLPVLLAVLGSVAFRSFFSALIYG